MKTLNIIFVVTLLIIGIGYVLIPGPDYPAPPADAVQSQEKADSESSLRRAYFSNYTREEVIKHYQEEFNISPWRNIPFPTLRLNYPPEDSQTLIRDQTRSTFLEELAHPYRESLYINGFEPKEKKDDIWYKGVHYRQKIIIKMVPNNVFFRVIMVSLTVGCLWLILKEYLSLFLLLKRKTK